MREAQNAVAEQQRDDQKRRQQGTDRRRARRNRAPLRQLDACPPVNCSQHDSRVYDGIAGEDHGAPGIAPGDAGRRGGLLPALVKRHAQLFLLAVAEDGQPGVRSRAAVTRLAGFVVTPLLVAGSRFAVVAVLRSVVVMTVPAAGLAPIFTGARAVLVAVRVPVPRVFPTRVPFSRSLDLARHDLHTALGAGAGLVRRR